MSSDQAMPKLAPTTHVIKADDFEFYNEAQTLLLRAQQEAQLTTQRAETRANELVETAKVKAQTIRESIQRQIVREREQLEPQLRAELSREIQIQYADLLLEAKARVARTRVDIDHEIVELALSTVRHLFGSLPRGKRTAAAALRALELVRCDTRVELRVHPDVLVEAQRVLKEAAMVSDVAKLVDLNADITLSPELGQMITSTGLIDINLEDTFNRLAANLRHAVGVDLAQVSSAATSNTEGKATINADFSLYCSQANPAQHHYLADIEKLYDLTPVQQQSLDGIAPAGDAAQD